MRNKKIWAFVLHYLFTFRFVCETVCFAKYETRFAWKMVYFAKYETRETNWIFSSKTKLVFHENLENYETKKFEWQPYVPTIKFETMTKNLVSQKCFFFTDQASFAGSKLVSRTKWPVSRNTKLVSYVKRSVSRNTKLVSHGKWYISRNTKLAKQTGFFRVKRN